MEDSLHYLPVNKWSELQEILKSDFPHSINGYYVLETQMRWKQQGYDYKFAVFCPYGDISGGMVAFNLGCPKLEIVIIGPKDDTKALEEALQTTKLIDWTQCIRIPFAPTNLLPLVDKIGRSLHREVEYIHCDRCVLSPEKPLYEVRLPPELTFKHLTLEHAELIDSKWPHNYQGSVEMYKTLIRNKNGYGLYKNQELVSWIFVSELGNLTHLYTLEGHRRKGYAEIVVKMTCNRMREEDAQRVVFTYVVKGNEKSYKLFLDLGFTMVDQVAWSFLN